MILSNMVNAVRIELSDTGEEKEYHEDTIIRGIEKSVALMSRLIPKRSIVETTIIIDFSETLTIADGYGYLAHRPVYTGSLVISGKTLDTDYQIDYLNGKVTSLNGSLPDAAYPVTYSLDTSMFDLYSILPDYIKVERFEYPTGQHPPTLVTVEHFGDFIAFKGDVRLAQGNHLRVVYLGKWTPPTEFADGNYPLHLDDLIIIGSVGQTLIFKAEKYTQEAAAAVIAAQSVLTGIDSIVVPTLSASPPTPPTLGSISVPTAPTLDVVTPPSPPALTDLTAPTAPTLSVLTPPTAPTLDTITVPTDYTFVKPTSPTLPGAPSTPGTPTLSYTDVDDALDEVSLQITQSENYLDAGDDLINAATRGDNVGETYGQYGEIAIRQALAFVEEAKQRLGMLNTELAEYAHKVTAYGSEVNEYANTISGTIGKFREEINAEQAGINNYLAQIQKYQAQVNNQRLAVEKYSEQIRGYQAEIEEDVRSINLYDRNIGKYQAEINEESMKIGKYQAEVQAYQAEVTEQNMKINKFAEEVRIYQAQVTAQGLQVSLFTEEVRVYVAQVDAYQAEITAYNTQVNAAINRAGQSTGQIEGFLNAGGRLLASGQAKINEFITALGRRPESVGGKANTGQFS